MLFRQNLIGETSTHPDSEYAPGNKKHHGQAQQVPFAIIYVWEDIE